MFFLVFVNVMYDFFDCCSIVASKIFFGEHIPRPFLEPANKLGDGCLNVVRKSKMGRKLWMYYYIHSENFEDFVSLGLSLLPVHHNTFVSLFSLFNNLCYRTRYTCYRERQCTRQRIIYNAKAESTAMALYINKYPRQSTQAFAVGVRVERSFHLFAIRDVKFKNVE